MKRVLYGSIIVLSAILMMSCVSKEKTMEDFFPIGTKNDHEQVFYADFTDVTVNCMEAAPDGSISCIIHGDEGLLFALKSNNETFTTVVEDSYDSVCYDDEKGVYYAHNIKSGQIELKGKRFETIGLLADGFKVSNVCEICIVGNELYLLCPIGKENDQVHDHMGDISASEHNYKYVYSISLTSAEVREIPIAGIISICPSDEKNIYIYSCRNEDYYIDVYNTVENTVEYSVELRNIHDIYSFSVANRKIYFTGEGYNGICSLDLRNMEISLIVPDVETFCQSDFELIENQLIFLDRRNMIISTLDTYSDEVLVVGNPEKQPSENRNTLTIAVETPSSQIVSLSKRYDFAIKYITPDPEDLSSSNEKMVRDFVSDNPQYDIYIIDMGYEYCNEIIEMGKCYPLESSKFLYTENKKYFDQISDYLTTEDGHIWGIPLRMNAMVLAGVPENLEKAEITEEDIADFFSLYKTLERIESMEESEVFIDGGAYGAYVLLNYISNNTNINMDNDIFVSYFDKMWTGWVQYGNMGKENHPLMGKVNEGFTLYEETCDINLETTLFNIVMEKDILENKLLQNTIKVYKLPLISSDYQNNIFISQVAVVNPKSECIAEAITFLEDLADYLHKNGELGVIYSDKKEYQATYDTDTGAFRDIYDINKSAVIMKNGPGFDIYMDVIPEYQHGRISLQEALDVAQDYVDSAK